MRKKKIAAVAAVCAAVAVLAAVIIADSLSSRTHRIDFSAMNTVVSLDIEGFRSQSAVTRISETVSRLDLVMLSRTAHGSEIYKLNSSDKPVVLSEQLTEYLATLKQLEKDSGGAFCISLGALSDLWDLGNGGYLPSQSEIDSALETKDGFSVNGNTASVADGAAVDFGSVGKGIACDSAKKILADAGCKRAIVAVGGSVLLWSKGEESFKIGIRNPLGSANEYAAVLETGDCCVSTSGNYERVFTAQDGKRYHHIFDPSTGYPARSGLQSVTVICESGLMSDALSTACFVLGYEKSLPLLEKYGASAVFITDGNEFITSPSFDGKLTVTDSRFSGGAVK